MTQFIQYLLVIINIYSTKEIMIKLSIAVFASILTPFIGFAHDGHGQTNGFTITHYFVEPQHALFTWCFLVGAFILVSHYRLKKKRSLK